MDEKMKDELTGALWGLAVLIVISLLFGCKSVKYVPVETVRTDSVYLDRYLRDSVYLHDSVFIAQYTRGDTVYVDKVSVKYRYRDRWRHDTVAVTRRDSVRVPVPVEKPLGWWQQARLKLFWPLVVVVVVLAVAVWWMIRRARKK